MATASSQITPEQLLRTSTGLAKRTHYLEALDLLDEAREILEKDGQRENRTYAEVLFASAQIKIKGRLYQDFPAIYVKTALKEVQAANMLREKLSGVPQQELAEGYFLEGFIHNRFFMRKREARDCFQRAVQLDPGNTAAKRELSGLLPHGDKK